MTVDWSVAATSPEPFLERRRRTAAKRRASLDDDLVTTIESQIIPRLVLAHVADGYEDVGCPDRRLPPSADEVRRMAELCVTQDMPGILDLVEGLSRGGLSLETVLLDLVAPTARLLGELWLDDEIGFTDVTLGLGTLQRVVAVLGRTVEPPLAHRGLVVLVAAPGEQHTLAIQLLGELLRDAGWGAHVEPTLGEQGLLDLVANEPVTMVGITLTNMAALPAVARLASELKAASMNADLAIMVGGAAELAAHAESLGVTYCASARDALARLARLERSNPSDHR